MRNISFTAPKAISALRRIIFVSLLSCSATISARSAESGLSFSVIQTAQSSGTSEAMVVEGGGLFTWRKLEHVAVLVHHPKGNFLWDTGMGSEARAQMEEFSFIDSVLFRIDNIIPARQQLDVNGYDMNQLMAIIPSHMHWDHASGIEDFLGVPIWVQQKSYDEAAAGQPPGFLQSQYDSNAINWKILKMTDQSYQDFPKSLDIFDDGSAVLVDLSGHTHGQLGLFLTIGNGKRYFFIGDTAWTVKGVNENKSRPAIERWLLGVDTDIEENAKVLEKIHQLSKKDNELTIVPAHDELQIKKLPHYPQFHQ
ncbi:MAG: N-acyl homoserine lactone hydrolase [Arenicella sp.]|jgi:N-acyl homoserine lactone hydrolase